MFFGEEREKKMPYANMPKKKKKKGEKIVALHYWTRRKKMALPAEREKSEAAEKRGKRGGNDRSVRANL